AVMLTPWLMVRIGGKSHGHAHEKIGGLGRIYMAVARPILVSRTRSWLFLAIVGILTVGSLGLFYTQAGTVKLLPFDNKTDLQVVIALPEGSAVEDTDRVLQPAVRLIEDAPHVASFQTYAATSAPFNFNGVVRHYYFRTMPNMGDIQVNLTEKGERERA